MGPLERPSTGWTRKDTEMQVGPQPDEKSRGWRPGDRNAAPSPLTPVLSFLLLLPLASTLQPTSLPFPELRLVGGPSRCQGRLEVLHGGSWGSVCDDDWDVVDANVVCRQLGCGLALPVPRPLAFGQGRGPILLDNVECRGQEAALSECGSRGWGVHNCFHYEDVAVLCDEFLPTQPPTRKVLTSRVPPTTPQNGKGEGSVRLVGGAGPCQGRVEILHGGLWGTVCDDDWGLPDATVVCRQLGCGAALAATTNAFFGYGTGHILLDNVHCEGGEPRLAACLSLGWGVHNCGHHEDAGALCAVLGHLTLTALPPSGTRADWAWHTEPEATGVGALPSREPALFTTAAWAAGKRTPLDGHHEDAGALCSGKAAAGPRMPGGTGRAERHLRNGGGGGGVQRADAYSDTGGACCEMGGTGAGAHRGAGGMRQALGKGRGLAQARSAAREGRGLLGNGRGRASELAEALRRERRGRGFTLRRQRRSPPSARSAAARHERGREGSALCCSEGRGPRVKEAQPTFLYQGAGTYEVLSDPKSVLPWRVRGDLASRDLFPNVTATCFFVLAEPGPDELVQQDGAETTQVPTPRPRDGHLRLANGAHRCEGRVELFLGQQWGTVCDDAWDMRAAGVLCHQLGCGQALAAPGEAHFGPGRGPILLDNVKCRGDESALLLCSHIRWDAHNCDHSEDASVLCQPS
ncbi:scavenger receptor cysteine-rich domain-containing group B protein [Neophocaena asiaeorientalis asiaeorientalis]|uniref:Scavenger receptor cysteine-rich domain-containing group B protein n=1 Tax=Neophocaena asiaeorientalis asiaeorientalis TaxID=1706337 RepID=A0A341BH75_NEOAA|nr:scavenger receptor cysteine-rich domain-containing group B protein [Neophocaena asiaeorientalis asiaeorientalis]